MARSQHNIKISSNTAVTRITYEGIASYKTLVDFDKKSIKSLPSTCKNMIQKKTEDLGNCVVEVDIHGAKMFQSPFVGWWLHQILQSIILQLEGA